mmetsp:Transcript_37226/g.86835  ORF Transcript_37226/g.86835 Transcript_37226/m.86835 type:complete len:80 (-) Transcript_37226:43-282(-)
MSTYYSVTWFFVYFHSNVQVVDSNKYPQLVSLRNCFVRGSVIRYIQIPSSEVDTELLQDAARKENAPKSSTTGKRKEKA